MKKKINLRPKMLYLGLWAGILKNYCHICNQCPPFCLIAKFLAKVPYLGVLGSSFEKPLSYLKPVPFNLPYCKFGANTSLLEGPLFLKVRGPFFLRVRVRVRFIKYALSKYVTVWFS